VDSGIGIEPSMLPHIFDPFVQVDGESEQGLKGLGIGLALLRRLVEMHGGTATVRSDGLGKGAEFAIRLPLIVAADERAAGAQSRHQVRKHHLLRRRAALQAAARRAEVARTSPHASIAPAAATGFHRLF